MAGEPLDQVDGLHRVRRALAPLRGDKETAQNSQLDMKNALFRLNHTTCLGTESDRVDHKPGARLGSIFCRKSTFCDVGVRSCTGSAK